MVTNFGFVRNDYDLGLTDCNLVLTDIGFVCSDYDFVWFCGLFLVLSKYLRKWFKKFWKVVPEGFAVLFLN